VGKILWEINARSWREVLVKECWRLHLLQKFERSYGMTSKIFSEKWKKGETDWVADSVAWITLFESYQTLNGHDV